MHTLLKDVFNFVYPDTCAGCQNPLLTAEEHLCTSCQVELPKTFIRDFKDNQVQKVFTGRCDMKKAAAMYAFQKGGILQHVLHEIKYRGNKSLAHTMGYFAGRYFLKHDFFRDIDFVIPIPLHPKKLKRRGYNQSTELAIGVQNAHPDLVINEDILQRDIHNTSQTQKSRFNRWLNVECIFALTADAEKYQGKHLLLFDDVVTTGATIEAAYNKLIHIKDVKISFLALAVA